MSAPAAEALPPRARPVGAPAARWRLDSAPPVLWADHVAACGGSFFHTPPALHVSLPPGTPLYARLEAGGRTVAVALGVETRCRLSRRPRHVRLAAPPACGPGADPAGAASGLAAALAGRGAAEVVMESFGGGVAACRDGAVPTRPRHEHVVALDTDADGLLARMGKGHRRHANRGMREEWSLRELHGAPAARLLEEVQQLAAARALGRGDGFHPAPLPAAVQDSVGCDRAWGIATLAAFHGAEPLAVAAVGWGGGRGFYLLGGSTAQGYRRSAAAWLHWRIMAHLRAHGLASYDLGGTPEGAERPGDPAHGLYRFKAGFGADRVECRGARWEPAPRHLALHRIAVLLTGGRR